MVNSDLFTTGTRSLERTDVPDVLDGLAGTRFLLRGYPASDTGKLLLILISRYIEKLDGFWTYDEALIGDLTAYIRRNL